LSLWRHKMRIDSVSQPRQAKSRTRIRGRETQAILQSWPKGDENHGKCATCQRAS
jgi:hypothetical protein